MHSIQFLEQNIRKYGLTAHINLLMQTQQTENKYVFFVVVEEIFFVSKMYEIIAVGLVSYVFPRLSCTVLRYREQ